MTISPSLFAADGMKYVDNANSHSVSVIDTNNNIVGSPLDIGEVPFGIAFDPIHNRMYVANGLSDSVSVIDTNTNTVVDPPLIVGSVPIGIAFAP